MSMQIRLKEGSALGERRWFNPERDIVNAWPPLLRKTLESFQDFKGVDGCSMEQLSVAAGSLGKQIVKIIREPVDHELVTAELQEWHAACPACADEIMRRAFTVLHGVYAAWVVDAKPKTDVDQEIPTVGLGQIAAWLAKNAPTK